MKAFPILLALPFLLSTISLKAQDTPGSPPQWVRTEKTDSFSNAKFSEFSLEGKFLTAPSSATLPKPSFVLDCIEGDHHNGKNQFHGRLGSAFILVGAVLNSGSSGTPMMFRLDDGKSQLANADKSTNGSALFLSEITLDTFLYGHFLPHRANTNPPIKKLVIAVDEAFAGRIVMQFDLPTPDVVERVCGVTYEK